MVWRKNGIVSVGYELKCSFELTLKAELDCQPISLRIDLFKKMYSISIYRARVFRSEIFTIQPSNPTKKNGTPAHKACMEELWIEDSFLWFSNIDIKAKNIRSAIKVVVRAIENCRAWR